MIIRKLLFSNPIKCVLITLLAMLFSMGPTKLAAQTAAQNQRVGDDTTAGGGNAAKSSGAANSDTASAPGAGKPADVNAEVLKELEQMRVRIQQLEAQLKTQGTSSPAAIAATSDSSSGSSAIELSVAKPADGVSAPQQQQAAPSKPEPAVPFAYADWTWLNGNARNKDAVWDSKFFTPEIRLDTNYISSFNHPRDDSLGGSTETFRSNEVQIEQISFGGDFHWDNVRARILTMGGMFGVTTPRNDASPGRGQWDLRGAYKYFSEANGGYHWNVNHGLNFQLVRGEPLDPDAVEEPGCVG